MTRTHSRGHREYQPNTCTATADPYLGWEAWSARQRRGWWRPTATTRRRVGRGARCGGRLSWGTPSELAAEIGAEAAWPSGLGWLTVDGRCRFRPCSYGWGNLVALSSHTEGAGVRLAVALLLVRVVLAAVFAVAALGKLADLDASREAVERFGLPARWRDRRGCCFR
jgi:hypothetical protein